jgi:hypothetical protein
MARQVSWRRSNAGDLPCWTANINNRWYNAKGFNLKLKLNAAMRSSFINKNARLEVHRTIEGSRKTELLFSREYESTWKAKEVVDAILTICNIMMLKDNEKAEAWFLEVLSSYVGAEQPVQPEGVSTTPGGRTYKHWY